MKKRTGTRTTGAWKVKASCLCFFALLAFCLGTSSGCGRKSEVTLLEARTDSGGNGDSENDGNSAKSVSSGKSRESGESKTDGSGETGESKETAESGETGKAGEEPEEPAGIYVYVCGAVANPGVYTLGADSRVFEAIAMAGGMLPEGDAGGLNQAERLTDGQMVRVLTKEEVAAGVTAGASQPETSAGAPEAQGKLDLNRATKEQLMTLPGIGAAKAESIISYRDANKGFQSIEDLMKIEGIKEGVFNKLKDSITVN